MDGGVDRLLLALGDTRANRALVAGMGEAMSTLLPIRGRAALAALGSEHDPGGSLMILV